MEHYAGPTASHEHATFGELLRYLRRREQLTQRELSLRVGYSEAQISRLEQNQRLPDPVAVKALFVSALHLDGQPDLAARLVALAESARDHEVPAAGTPPYKGLLYFDLADADMFFGREALTERLTRHVIDLAQRAPCRFLAVVGASGCGKSSLVRAGLAVALQRDGWRVHVQVPTDAFLRASPTALHTAVPGRGGRILLLVDHFEEVFTQCRDEAQRVAYVDGLIDLAEAPSGRTTVVVTLRADFYAHCGRYARLRQAVAAHQEYVGQMSVDELRRAIEEPAKRGGWQLEAGFVDVLLRDLGAWASDEPEPGALPLLSHALLATWARRRGRRLTLAAYRASGGVRTAIAETAESVFTERLSRSQQGLAREVFLHLTDLHERTVVARRRVPLVELDRSTNSSQLRSVLNILAEARLILLHEDSVELAHEVLVREWRRLDEWVVQDRESLLLHRHLSATAREWEARGRDPAELYRGARLSEAQLWAATNADKLSALERLFLMTCVECHEQELAEREAQLACEREIAWQRGEDGPGDTDSASGPGGSPS